MKTPIVVLFVCLGNACRSPMAEKICNAYGEGKIVADSAGVHEALPNILLDQATIDVMRDIGIDITTHKPKHIVTVDSARFDVMVNMAPLPTQGVVTSYLPNFEGRMLEWTVTDPRGQSRNVYESVRDDLKEKVFGLIQELTASAF